MKDGLGLDVPPQQAAHRPCQAGSHQGELEGVRYLVDAVMTEDPEADAGEHEEGHGRGASEQPLDAIGEVHGVRAAPEDRHEHEDVQPARQAQGGVLAVRERQLPAAPRRGDHGQRVPQAHECLQDGLLQLPQAQVPFPEDLHPVVEQADSAHGYDGQRSRDADSARGVTRDGQRDGEDGDERQRDHGPAHGRGAGLLGVVVHLVVNGLADTAPAQQPDQERGQQQREDERHPAGDKQSDHRATIGERGQGSANDTPAWRHGHSLSGITHPAPADVRPCEGS
jgi:hypothetical protein